jgi:hypothetical protein
MNSMAGNLLPLVALAGAAFFLTRKSDAPAAKTDECDPLNPESWADGKICVQQNGRWVLADAGDIGSDGISGLPILEDEGAFFDKTLQMPMITTSEDHEKWGAVIQDKNPIWVGSIEFFDMDAYLEETAQFIETEMDLYENVYGRTIDRSELDPVAAAAMVEENAMVENGIAQLFAGNTGLEMLFLFIKPEGSQSMSVYFLFDTEANQNAALGNIDAFKVALEGMGVQSYLRYGNRDMSSPSVKESISAYLAAMLPKKSVEMGFVPTGNQPSFNPNP